MTRRASFALGGAVGGLCLLFITWFAAFHIGFMERADGTVLHGFGGLNHQRVDLLAFHIAVLCNPKPYVYFAAVPVLVALLRRRFRLSLAIVAILLGANLTTQFLKPLLAAPRLATQAAGHAHVDAVSWPSGHATAAMALALCAVLAAPARLRPLVAVLGAAFAAVVSYSFLTLGWHYPSDVFGGFLVAIVWTLLCAAAVYAFDARHARATDAEPSRRLSVRSALAQAVAVVACGLVVVALVALARPHAVVTYARAHTTFIVGAAAIGTLALALAIGLALLSGMDSGRQMSVTGREREAP
jgi:membrane-associated phospholipid phosphatase